MTTRSELVELLSQRFPQLSLNDTRMVVDTIINAISDTLANQNRVEIRGFGSFSLGVRQARQGRNPKTGESVQVPGKNVVRFKAGKEMRGGVDY